MKEYEKQICFMLRDCLHLLEANVADEGKFAHWTDGDVAVKALESWNGALAVQFAPPDHFVTFKHNREDR